MKNLPTEIIVIICHHLRDDEKKLVRLCQTGCKYRNIVYDTYAYQIPYLLRDKVQFCLDFEYLCQKACYCENPVYVNYIGLLKYYCWNYINPKDCLAVLCRYGHLKVAQYIVKTFNFSYNDVSRNNNWAISWACRGGHLEMVQWLFETFYFDDNDPHLPFQVLSWACEYGRLEIAQWLVKMHNFNYFLPFNHNCLVRACENGHFDMVRWLVKTFNLTAVDVRYNHNLAICYACTNDHLEIVRWLADTFNLNIYKN